MMTKSDIRREIRGQRRQLDSAWVLQTSQLIQQFVLGLPEWTAARQVFCYLAVSAEVQTDKLLDACRQTGKLIWVPAWRAETGRYECARFDTGNALIQGRNRIPEPDQPIWADPLICDLVIVPGLAFDLQGGRIGHGAGYYDRLLARPVLSRALKIGLAFAFQLRDAVPVAAHDAAMDMIVTENAAFRRQG